MRHRLVRFGQDKALADPAAPSSPFLVCGGEKITEGLKQLLLENNYNPVTTHFHAREWKKIQSFLTTEYGDSEYEMKRGLKYLEK